VIELECPSISGDLTNPGVLEGLLLHLLTESIGVGQYPNRDRNPLDVAGSLIQMASQARAGQKTLQTSRKIARLASRTTPLASNSISSCEKRFQHKEKNPQELAVSY